MDTKRRIRAGFAFFDSQLGFRWWFFAAVGAQRLDHPLDLALENSRQVTPVNSTISSSVVALVNLRLSHELELNRKSGYFSGTKLRCHKIKSTKLRLR